MLVNGALGALSGFALFSSESARKWKEVRFAMHGYGLLTFFIQPTNKTKKNFLKEFPPFVALFYRAPGDIAAAPPKIFDSITHQPSHPSRDIR